MTDDEKIESLFRTTYKNVAINFNDYCRAQWGENDLLKYRIYADKLVDMGLVAYADNDRLRICITDKGELVGKESSYANLIRQQNSVQENEKLKEEIQAELDKVNLTLAKRQLKTFWLTMLIALVSLIISIVALLK